MSFHKSHCSFSVVLIKSAFSIFIPRTSVSRSGVFFMTSIVFSPNFVTSFLAVTSPTPFMMPEARYFSMAGTPSGRNFSNVSAFSCFP